MKPDVSVLIPVYNAEKYLPLCLSSVLKQSLTQLEIICIDDGSSDGSLDILNRTSREDPRVRVFTQKNQGVAATRNRLLAKARGRYVAFVDADDLIFPTYLEKLYAAAEGASGEMAKCFFYELEENGSPRVQEHCHSSFYRSPLLKDGSRFRAGYEDAVLWGKLFNRKWIEKNGFCFWPGRVAEDFSFVILAFLYAQKIAVVPEKLYCYRKGVTSAITANALNMATGILLNLLELRQDLIKRRKWTGAVSQEWIRAVVWGICRFRKFSAAVRQERQDLLASAWQTVAKEYGNCPGVQRLRWQMLRLFVYICGWNSVYFWSKIFR